MALAEVLLYASDQVVMDLLHYDGPREFDTWTYPVVTLDSGETVCLVGNPLRLYGRWMTALGAEPGAPPVDEHTASAKVAAAVRRFADAAAVQAALAADGLVCTVVQPSTTLLASEWAAEREVLGTAAPGVRAPASPWRSSAAEIRIAGPATVIGADTRDVLRDLLESGRARDRRPGGVGRHPSRWGMIQCPAWTFAVPCQVERRGRPASRRVLWAHHSAPTCESPTLSIMRKRWKWLVGALALLVVLGDRRAVSSTSTSSRVPLPPSSRCPRHAHTNVNFLLRIVHCAFFIVPDVERSRRHVSRQRGFGGGVPGSGSPGRSACNRRGEDVENLGVDHDRQRPGHVGDLHR